MEQTGHYGLKLPGENDYADVGILNENAQAVDAALYGLEERKADLDPGTGKVAESQMPAMDYAPSEHIHTWDEVQGKPEVFTPSGHRASHAAGGSDTITPADIGADPAGTASGAVAGHNVSTDAHPDIRQAVENAQRAADTALEVITKIAYTIDVVPTQSGSLTYTGGAQSPAWNSYNPDSLTLGGVTTGTNAGSYTATFTPKAGYTWADGTTAAKPVAWSIGRAAIGAVPSQYGGLTYNGAAQSPTWSNYNSGQLTIGGTANATNAGTYGAAFTPTANYRWADGSITAKTVYWSIGRAAIGAVPSQSGGLTYTGGALSPTWANYSSGQLTLGGTTSGVNAGSYAASFTPTGNYRWSDGSTAAKAVNWSIGKAAGSLALNTTSLTLTNGALTGTIAVTRVGDGAISAVSSNTGVATVSVSGTTVAVTGKAYGNATITVSVAAGSNHNAPASGTCSVAVRIFNTNLNANTWAQIREASELGIAANVWSVGDAKTITINGKVGNATFSNLSIDTFILGFNHNAGREGGKRIHFELGKIGGKITALEDSKYDYLANEANYFAMELDHLNNGGWNSCQMRNAILGNNGAPANPPASTMLAALPSDLRGAMKPCTKYSDNTGGGGDVASKVTATTDYLWLLSEFELFGSRKYANSAEQNYQAQYDYFKAGNDKTHFRQMRPTVAAKIWLRSVGAGADSWFCTVAMINNAPAQGSTTSHASLGIAPAFCV